MKKTAKSEYARIQKENATLLKLIASELKKHKSVAEDEGINYAHSGDLGHTKELMIELLTFLRGAADEDIMREQIEKEISERSN